MLQIAIVLLGIALFILLSMMIYGVSAREQERVYSTFHISALTFSIFVVVFLIIGCNAILLGKYDGREYLKDSESYKRDNIYVYTKYKCIYKAYSCDTCEAIFSRYTIITPTVSEPVVTLDKQGQ